MSVIFAGTAANIGTFTSTHFGLCIYPCIYIIYLFSSTWTGNRHILLPPWIFLIINAKSYDNFKTFIYTYAFFLFILHTEIMWYCNDGIFTISIIKKCSKTIYFAIKLVARVLNWNFWSEKCFFHRLCMGRYIDNPILLNVGKEGGCPPARKPHNLPIFIFILHVTHLPCIYLLLFPIICTYNAIGCIDSLAPGVGFSFSVNLLICTVLDPCVWLNLSIFLSILHFHWRGAKEGIQVDRPDSFLAVLLSSWISTYLMIELLR